MNSFTSQLSQLRSFLRKPKNAIGICIVPLAIIGVFSFQNFSKPVGILPGGQYILANGLLYFSNGQGQGCYYISKSQIDLTRATFIQSVPPENIGDSECNGDTILPPGQYLLPSGVEFFSNGEGGTCNYSSPANFGAATMIAAVPNGNGYNPNSYCAGWGGTLPAGQYFMPNGTEFFSNAQGQSCQYSNPSYVDNAFTLPSAPPGNDYNPNNYCQGWGGVLAAGQYILPSGVEFFSNGQGGTCNYSLPANIAQAQRVLSVPPGNGYSPENYCQGWGGVLPAGPYFLPNGVEFFSNGQGQSCNYSRPPTHDVGVPVMIPSVPPGNDYNPNNYCQGWGGVLPPGNYTLGDKSAIYSNGQGHVCYYGHQLTNVFFGATQALPSIPAGNINDGECGGGNDQPFVQDITFSLKPGDYYVTSVPKHLGAVKAGQAGFKNVADAVINLAFNNVLQRAPTSDELTQWETSLKLGVTGYQQIASLLPNQGLLNLMSYVSSSKSFDVNYLMTTAQSLGYAVTISGDTSAPPYTVNIVDPTSNSILFWVTSNEVVFFPASSVGRPQVCKVDALPNALLTDANGNVLVAPFTPNHKISLDLSQLPGGLSGSLVQGLKEAIQHFDSATASTAAPSFVTDGSGGASAGVYCSDNLGQNTGAGTLHYGSNGVKLGTIASPILANWFPGAFGSANGAKVMLNCNQIGGSNFYAFYHELGHILGFADSYTSAQEGIDPMFGYTLNQPYPPFTPAEITLINQIYSLDDYHYDKSNSTCQDFYEYYGMKPPTSPPPAPPVTNPTCTNTCPDGYQIDHDCNCELSCVPQNCATGTWDPVVCACTKTGATPCYNYCDYGFKGDGSCGCNPAPIGPVSCPDPGYQPGYTCQYDSVGCLRCYSPDTSGPGDPYDDCFDDECWDGA